MIQASGIKNVFFWQKVLETMMAVFRGTKLCTACTAVNAVVVNRAPPEKSSLEHFSLQNAAAVHHSELCGIIAAVAVSNLNMRA